MSPQQLQSIEPGLYRLFWTDGGMSVAAVGRDSAGAPWFAATDWVFGSWTDWSGVDRVELITTREQEEKHKELERTRLSSQLNTNEPQPVRVQPEHDGLTLTPPVQPAAPGKKGKPPHDRS